MDKIRFKDACESVMSAARGQGGIGTFGEKTLHAVLKSYFEPDTDKHEIKVGSFIADIVNDNSITEIQTRSLNALRKKLSAFLEHSPVTVVYPLPKTKWLLWIDGKTGEVTKKRKSPRQGRICDAIHELYKIRPLMDHPNFRLCIVMIDIEEYRYLDGWSEDKKKGSTRYDRIPVDIAEEICFDSPADYLQFVLDDLQRQFTAKDYKNSSKTNLRTAQTALNILHYIGAVKRVGKLGNSYVYERAVEYKR